MLSVLTCKTFSNPLWMFLGLLPSLRCAEEVLQLLEGFLASRYENEIVSTLCETVRIASPDALDAPVTRAVPFDGEMLIFFFSGLTFSLFTFHTLIGLARCALKIPSLRMRK